MSVINEAIARANARPAPRPIDYERMARSRRSQKAALTRAVKTKDPEKVAQVCKAAVAEWDACGAWPDDWSNWQRALDDALPWHQHVDLRDL